MMTTDPAQNSPGNGPTHLGTVVVLGVSYGGGHASKLLASGLPEGWRVVAIDRNSHFNHQYVFPRFIALSEHAPKAFVPYQNLLKLPPAPEVEPEPGSPASFQVTQKRGVTNGPHRFINGLVSRLDKHAVTVSLADGGEETIPFEYCIYALGAILPAPCDVWGENALGRGTKTGAVAWMQRQKGVIERAPRILVIGGGALGIQFATDIKNIYPEKEVTMVHSRTRMLPRYPQEMHDAAVEGLERLGVRVFLGHRVVSWPSTPCMEEGSEKVVRTDSGQTFTADLVLACTGTRANSKLMATMEPACVNPSNGRIAVRPTTQVKRFDLGEDMEGLRVGEDVPLKVGEVAKDRDADLDHIFAIGDCADTPAIQAGHVSYYQGVVAVKNILKMIQRDARNKGSAKVDRTPEAQSEKEAKEAEQLDLYTPTPPMLKLTLGLKHYATAMPDGVTLGDDGVEDLAARVMWGVYHADEMPDDA